MVEKRKPATLSAFIEAVMAHPSGSFYPPSDRAQPRERGARGVKMKHLRYLFGEARPLEARYIARLALDDMRIAGEGLVRDAIAKAFGASPEEVERSYNFTSDLGLVAQRRRSAGSLT